MHPIARDGACSLQKYAKSILNTGLWWFSKMARLGEEEYFEEARGIFYGAVFQHFAFQSLC